MGVLFANRYKSTISAAVTAAATTIPVSSAAGLPAPAVGDYFYLTLTSPDQQTIEIVRVTAVAGGNLTVARGQEGTAGTAWPLGTAIELRLTTQSLLDALAERLGVAATAAEAVKLATARTISATGPISWNVSFDGSGDASAAATIAANAVTPGNIAQTTGAAFLGASTAATPSFLDMATARTMLSISNVENKSSATILSELTSANVTNALGFTPAVQGHSHAVATTTVDGFMAAADKSKLDGVASGATANTGTVTSVSVVSANGVSGTVATSGTTPAITIVLGAITPSSVAATGAVTGSNLSGTNTGDQFTSVATSTFIGRATDGNGPAEVLTAAQATDLLDLALAGGAKGLMSGADKAKLDGIAAGATVNAADAQLRDRSTHTGTQDASTITGLGTAATQNIHVGTTAPASPAANDLWVDTN